MKKVLPVLLIVLFLALALVSPVVAQDTTPTSEGTIFAGMTAAWNTLMQAVGIGAALSVLNQLGKITFPKAFPNDSSQNWRLGAIFILTLVVTFVPKLFPQFAGYLTIGNLDQLAGDFAEFASLLVPLFIVVAKWASEFFYKNVLKGTAVIGKSWNPPTKTPASVPAPAIKK